MLPMSNASIVWKVSDCNIGRCSPRSCSQCSVWASLRPPYQAGRISAVRRVTSTSSRTSTGTGRRQGRSVSCMEAGSSVSTVSRNRTACSGSLTPPSITIGSSTGTGMTVGFQLQFTKGGFRKTINDGMRTIFWATLIESVLQRNFQLNLGMLFQ